jgi:hypothetical protein
MTRAGKKFLTRAALVGGVMALGATLAGPAAAQGTTTAQSGSAYAFGGQIALTDQDVLPPNAEASVEAPPFEDDADEALVEVPADPLAISYTARGTASVHADADLASVLGEDAEPQAVDGPYNAQAVGAVEDLEVLVDAVADDVPFIRADLVRGEAVGVCVGDEAVYSASSEIVNLVIGGETVPVNAPLSEIVDAITEVLEQTTLNQVVDVRRNVVSELGGGGIAVDALVVTVLAAAGDDPLVTIRLGHGEVGPLACGPAAETPEEVVELPFEGAPAAPTGPAAPSAPAAPVTTAELPAPGPPSPLPSPGSPPWPVSASPVSAGSPPAPERTHRRPVDPDPLGRIGGAVRSLAG